MYIILSDFNMFAGIALQSHEWNEKLATNVLPRVTQTTFMSYVYLFVLVSRHSNVIVNQVSAGPTIAGTSQLQSVTTKLILTDERFSGLFFVRPRQGYEKVLSREILCRVNSFVQ
jgi:hypothetical protein